MKIPHTHPNVTPLTTTTRDSSRPASGQAQATGTDAVRLSGDLHLAERAVRAAAAGEDRSELVEVLRAQYERGELSVDAERLADRMIDALIHSNDTP